MEVAAGLDEKRKLGGGKLGRMCREGRGHARIIRGAAAVSGRRDYI
jgi:hypothetical protein